MDTNGLNTTFPYESTNQGATVNVSTREQYLELFPSTSAAIEFEHSVLTSGREFLPPQAILVIEGGAQPGPDYWQFLADQLDAADLDEQMREGERG